MKQRDSESAVSSHRPSRDPSIQSLSAPIDMSTRETDLDIDQSLDEGARDEIGADTRHTMIREAAYDRYEKRGHIDGYAADDWLEAEAEIDHLLRHRPTSAAIS